MTYLKLFLKLVDCEKIGCLLLTMKHYFGSCEVCVSMS